jgi:glycosyltransferase involved in cell wall biosynthesis
MNSKIMAPLVSILIPAFNAQKFIAETIRSATGQTWNRKEVIIVDDGSRDNTLEVAKSFESSCVKVVSQENRGAAAARNKALSMAQGDFIQWLDADDLLHAEKLQHQLSDIQASDAMMLHSSEFRRFVRLPDKASRMSNVLFQDLTPKEWLYLAMANGAWLSPISWLASRQLTEATGPWDERLSAGPNDDGEYSSRMVSLSAGVRFHPNARCFYRGGTLGTLSSVRSSRALDALLLSVNLSIDHYLKLERSERSAQAAVSFMQYVIDRFDVADPRVWNRFRDRAEELGGTVTPPRKSVLFTVARKVLGQPAAAKGKAVLGRAKWIVSAWAENLR